MLYNPDRCLVGQSIGLQVAAIFLTEIVWHIPQLSASSKHKQLFVRIQVDFAVPVGWFECLEVEASESAEQIVR